MSEAAKPLVVTTQNEGAVVDFREIYGDVDALFIDYSESKENAEYAAQCWIEAHSYADRLPAQVLKTITDSLTEQHSDIAELAKAYEAGDFEVFADR
jgi:hypothetical protein